MVILGDAPSLVDAEPSALSPNCGAGRKVPFERSELLRALEPQRSISLRQADGSAASTIVHQIREDGDERLLFLCNTDRAHGFDECGSISPGAGASLRSIRHRTRAESGRGFAGATRLRLTSLRMVTSCCACGRAGSRAVRPVTAEAGAGSRTYRPLSRHALRAQRAAARPGRVPAR